MTSIEVAFEERVKQIETGAKGDNNKGMPLAECSPFDQALAAVLLMNDGKPLKGKVARRLQQVCCELEALLRGGGTVTSTSKSSDSNSKSKGQQHIVWRE